MSVREKFSKETPVMYSRRFLRSIGAYAGEIPFRTGVVVGVETVGKREFVRVAWDDSEETNLVIPSNLTTSRREVD